MQNPRLDAQLVDAWQNATHTSELQIPSVNAEPIDAWIIAEHSSDSDMQNLSAHAQPVDVR